MLIQMWIDTLQEILRGSLRLLSYSPIDNNPFTLRLMSASFEPHHVCKPCIRAQLTQSLFDLLWQVVKPYTRAQSHLGLVSN